MTEKEKAALAWLNKKQNEKNEFTNIGPDEVNRAIKIMEGNKNA